MELEIIMLSEQTTFFSHLWMFGSREQGHENRVGMDREVEGKGGLEVIEK
jgi:hypothetical protein